jgi:hypothetical protein
MTPPRDPANAISATFQPAPLPGLNMDAPPPQKARGMDDEGGERDHYQEEGLMDPAERDDADLLSMLVRYADEAELSSLTARTKAERDRDYLDGKQLTQEEYDALVKRGQPPIAFNVIRSRVDFHQGMEKKLRRDPKCEPRTDQDVDGAEAFTDGLRYVTQVADYPTHRSAAWKNITVEGYGGIELWVEKNRKGRYAIKMAHMPWDRLLFDPHAQKPDFSDGKYRGLVTWLDYEDVITKYEEKAADNGHDIRDLITSTVSPRSWNDTFDDKPKQNLWADSKRRRVKVVTMWVNHPGIGWWWYDFTLAGIIDAGESPYIDAETGDTYCPWLWESCHIDRDNNRYGVVRDLIDPQDELNKRRSKALHLLNSMGVVMDEGAVADVNKLRRELAKPDFIVQKTPGSDFNLERQTELVRGQVELMHSAMEFIMSSGPNQALLGDGVSDQSGKAIGLQQAGGLVEQGDLMDTLRRLDLNVFRMVYNLVKQFWTEETWIRVTDNPLTPRFVGLNVQQAVTQPVLDPATGQPAVDPATGEPVPPQPVIDPATGQPQTQIVNSTADLDLDVIVTDADEMVTLDDANYQSLTQLMAQFGNLPIPLIRLAIELHPSLPARRKKQALDILDQMQAQAAKPNPMQEAATQLQLGKAKSEIDLNTAKTAHTAVETELKMRHGHHQMLPPPAPQGPPAGKEQVLGQGALERPGQAAA